MRRRHPLPRSAPPAPSGMTSAAPACRPGTRPPGNPASSTPGRIATDGHSHAGGTPGPRASAPASALSMRLEPLGQPATQDHLDRAVGDGGNPRAVDSPPAAAIARRIAARHTNRQSQRRKHGPHPLPRPAPGRATRPRTARSPNASRISRSRHPTSTSSRSSEPTCRTGYSAAPNSSRCRSAASTSAVVAARNPTPSSTSIANSTRPRPSTRQRRSGILPSSDRGPGPPPPVVWLRRNVPSRRRPGPGPRVAHAHLPGQRRRRISAAACPPATPHRAHRAARRPAPRPRRVRPTRSVPAGCEPR